MSFSSIEKFLYSSFRFPWKVVESTCFFKNNVMPLAIHLLEKIVSHLRKIVSQQVSSKNKKTLNLWPKVPYLGIFGLQFNKNIYRIFNHHLSFKIFNNHFSSKMKKKKKKKKKDCDQKCFSWVFGLECWNVIFVINTLQFVYKVLNKN